MKKRIKAIQKYIIAIAVFILATALIIGIFFISIRKQVEKNSRDTLMVNVTRQSEHLKEVFDIHFQYLNVVAENLGSKDKLISDANLEILTSLKEKTDMELTSIITPDGISHYANGQEKDVSQREYFQKAIEGNEVLSDPLESSVDHTTRVVLAVPFMKNDKVIGVVAGSYNVTKLSRLMFDDLFGGSGYSLIMDAEGNIITCDNADGFDQGDNIFVDQISDMKQKKQEIEKDLSRQENGFIYLDTTHDSKTDHYLAYTPLGINDWMVGYVIAVDIAQSDYSFIESYEYMFVSVFILFVLILILFIMVTNRTEKEKLVITAHTDALTGLFNKDYTQQAIDSYLNGSEGNNCFLIMDVDNFKHVNDTYGHAAGDAVLRTLGHLYYDSFRKGDIVGRIGGDEFVILMKDVNETIVSDKLEFLLREVRRMRVDEIKDEQISISIGACMAPENGTSFMELYRKADSALYETKKTTKNGFTIYKS